MLFKKYNANVIKALVDVVHNIIKGNVRISSGSKNKLKKYKQQLRHLTKPSVSLKSKKQYIIQKGGFLPFLAPLIPLFIKAAVVAGPVIAKAALAEAAGTAASVAVNKIAQNV